MSHGKYREFSKFFKNSSMSEGNLIVRSSIVETSSENLPKEHYIEIACGILYTVAYSVKITIHPPHIKLSGGFRGGVHTPLTLLSECMGMQKMKFILILTNLCKRIQGSWYGSTSSQ